MSMAEPLSTSWLNILKSISHAYILNLVPFLTNTRNIALACLQAKQ